MIRFVDLSIVAAALGLLSACGNHDEHQRARSAPSGVLPEEAVPSAGRVAIAVDERGYHPATIHVKRGEPVTLVFTRTTDQGCSRDLVFPEQNIRRALPVGQPVEVRLTPTTDTVAFTCGMGMLEGRILAHSDDQPSVPAPTPTPTPTPTQTPTPAPTQTRTPTPTPSPTPASISPETRSAIEATLAAYERIRATLAADRTAGVSTAAQGVEASARRAASSAPERLRPRLEAVATAARGVKTSPQSDVGALRRAFGELSRPMVALVVAEPSLSRGRHVFECPMANGYRKWIQPGANISNPYMGTRMPTCGSATDWRE